MAATKKSFSYKVNHLFKIKLTKNHYKKMEEYEIKEQEQRGY